MENAFSVTFSQMLVLFSFMLIGFFLNRKKIMPENTGVILSKAENYVFMPCLILNTFITKCTVTTLREKGDLLLYSTAALFLAILLAYGLARFFSKDAYTRNVYKYALAIGNFGFMGNAVVLAVFGEAMLFDYLIFTLPLNIAVYTWGLMILIPGGGKKAPLKNLLNPVCLSLAAGILLGLLSAQTFLPAFVMSAVSAGGACMAPVAMLLTGFTIGSYDLKKILLNGKIYLVSALRLLVIPAVFLLLFKAMAAPEEVLLLTFFSFATPIGLNTIVFPAAYGGEPITGAGMALISHTLSVITIPVLFAVLL